MTNRDVDNLITTAAAAGREIDRRDALIILRSREYLADPKAVAGSRYSEKHLRRVAKLVLESFAQLMKTGERRRTIFFARFVLPHFEVEPEEDLRREDA